MTVLSPLQLMDYARQAGFTGTSQAIVVAIAEAESGGNTLIRGRTDPRDRGVLQINSFWHGEVSDNCAFDPACSFREAYRISDSGTKFTEWTTYTTGAYQKYLSGLPTGAAAGLPAPITQPITQSSSPLTAWITGMGPFFAWISNPLRVAKLLVGIILIGLSIYMLATPGGEEKIMSMAKGVGSNVSSGGSSSP